MASPSMSLTAPTNPSLNPNPPASPPMDSGFSPLSPGKSPAPPIFPSNSRGTPRAARSEEHTSELQSLPLACALPISPIHPLHPLWTVGFLPSRLGNRPLHQFFRRTRGAHRERQDRRSTRLNSSHFP